MSSSPTLEELFKTFESSIYKKIDDAVKPIGDGIDKLSEGQKQLAAETKQLAVEQKQLAAEQKEQKQAIGRLEENIGVLAEHVWRVSVAKLFNERFAKSYVIQSIADIPSFFKPNHKPYYYEDRQVDLLKLVGAVRPEIPRFYDAFVAAIPQYNWPSYSELVRESRLDSDCMQRIFCSLSQFSQDKHELTWLALRLKDFFSGSRDLTDRYLTSSAGLGLPIAIWLALGEFQSQMEIDCRGR
jgi:hypothetical protein